MQSIISTLDEVEKDSRGMVLTSTSKSVFCAGLDLKEMYKPEEQRLRQFWSTLQELWIRLYSLKVPCAAGNRKFAKKGIDIVDGNYTVTFSKICPHIG